MIITSPPTIIQGFTSLTPPIGHYVALNCSIAGNPKPLIKWYRNGELLKYGSILYYQEPTLIINTYEERHKGVYQCVASNVAGEVQVTGQLNWEMKTYMKRPRNVTCYPINYSTLLVTFESDYEVNL